MSKPSCLAALLAAACAVAGAQPLAATPAAPVAPASASASASASAPAAAASGPQRTQRWLVRPGQGSYSPELAASGVQGEAQVLVSLDPEGHVTHAATQESARSPQLDATALVFVKGLELKPHPGKPAPAELLIPVLFLKDSVKTLPDKTCPDFTADATYYATTFPDRPVSDMTVVRMSVGALFTALMVHPRPDALADLARRVGDEGIRKVIAECAAHPDRKYFDTFQKVVAP